MFSFVFLGAISVGSFLFRLLISHGTCWSFGLRRTSASYSFSCFNAFGSLRSGLFPFNSNAYYLEFDSWTLGDFRWIYPNPLGRFRLLRLPISRNIWNLMIWT